MNNEVDYTTTLVAPDGTETVIGHVERFTFVKSPVLPEMTREAVEAAIVELESIGEPQPAEVPVHVAMEIAKAMWWASRTEADQGRGIRSREGLNYLFPGLGSKVKKGKK